MNSCTGWSPPLNKFIAQESVKVKDFCASRIWRRSFQPKKRPNIIRVNRIMHTELMQKNIGNNIFIQAGKLSCHLVIFLAFLMGI